MEWKDKPVEKKYNDIQQSLKVINYYLGLYTHAEKSKPVIDFESTRDMAKFFKMMLDPLIE